MADIRRYSIHLVSADGALCYALACALRNLGHAVEAFESASQYLGLGRTRRADCVMVDQDLPHSAASQLQQPVRSAIVRVPVICFATAASTANVVRAMRAGAFDFLCAPFGQVDLARSVEAAAKVAREWHEEDERRARARMLYGSLTPREREVLALVLEGKLNKQIAACLSSQEATVKVHRSRLMRKLEVRSLVALIRFGQELDGATWPDPLPLASAAAKHCGTRSGPVSLYGAVVARSSTEFRRQVA